MYRATMAFQAQAAGWIESYKGWLATQGLGFTDDDLAAIAASHAAHPYPEGYGPGHVTSAADQATVAEMQAKVMATVFPEGGIPSDDPRLTVGGIPLVAMAILAKAIEWNGEDAELTARCVTALGHTVEQWEVAGEAWKQLASDDMVVATFYGQLYSQVGELPRR